MTQEDKQLIFRDLCARLPYNVIVKNINLNFDGYVLSTHKYQPFCVLTSDLSGGKDQGFSPIEDIRAYLRPLSSMKEEEEQYVLDTWSEDSFNNGIDLMYDNYMMLGYASDFIDWLNAHHFDYRGLIEKGLAIEAPEGMY